MVVEILGLECRYKGTDFLLSDINFRCQRGEILLINGPNGAGKSTLLKILSGIDTGDLEYDKAKINLHSQPVIIYPDPRDQILTFTVKEELSTRLSYSRIPRKQRFSVVSDIMNQFHLHKFASRDPRRLSSGEQQIVISLAQLIDKSEIILIDEPLRYLDYLNIKLFLDFLSQLHDLGKTLIIASHTSYFNEIATQVYSLGKRKKSETMITYGETSSINVHFIVGSIGYNEILKEVNLSFPRNGIRVISGNNGSGKSLLLKTLSGLVKLKKGEINFPSEIGYLPEKPEALFSNPTVAEELHGLDPPNELRPYLGHSPFQLSTGYKKLLAITILSQTFETLLLDEPFQSLDDVHIKTVWKILKLHSVHKLVLITTNRDLKDIGIDISKELIMEL